MNVGVEVYNIRDVDIKIFLGSERNIKGIFYFGKVVIRIRVFLFKLSLRWINILNYGVKFVWYV